LGLKQRRHYTNTSVYTRMDSMSPEEHLKVLLEEQQYLIELLKTDDSQAPWCKQNVITVSREVQYGLHEPQDCRRATTFAFATVSRRTFTTMDHAAKKPESAYEPIIDYKQSYLQDLLKADDADAAWNQTPIEMVSREVQSSISDHSTWN
ncbi:hypothetical protein GGI03_001248, partial [Coemansia sp. RSA 2337]